MSRGAGKDGSREGQGDGSVAREIARLKEEIFLLQTLMDHVPDYIYFKDRQSRFTRVNRYAAARYGIADPALAIGKTDFDFFAEEHAAKALRDLEGNIVGTFGISRDISERKRAEESLERQASHDPLTKLPNRMLFMNRFESLFRRANRSPGRRTFALLYIDVDHFKAVNDSLGHQAGDELLVAVARRLEHCVRPGDTLARLGGDEFTVLLEGIWAEADATAVATRVAEELAVPIPVHGQEVSTSVSVGIALAIAGYDRPEDMLSAADAAMYRAKAAGRARYEIAGRPG